MRSKKYMICRAIVIILVVMGGAGLVQAQGNSGLIAPGATLTEVQSGFQLAEGPAADREGNIYTAWKVIRN